ncbi:hypothetical protein STRIC_2123 [Streptococcus ictaluri 707-05]|uniref:Uncharacterized protein n=1 Tax=Streptococcus ictaluri 707-05 TaxID=764299 RepID=G5K5K7_9STRE|nr:hypothetical protein STRIC_2123 [Streptococcus ictaluri 707-05]
MKQLGASEEETDDYIWLCMFKKPHVIAQVRKKARIFRSEGWVTDD